MSISAPLVPVRLLLATVASLALIRLGAVEYAFSDVAPPKPATWGSLQVRQAHMHANGWMAVAVERVGGAGEPSSIFVRDPLLGSWREIGAPLAPGYDYTPAGYDIRVNSLGHVAVTRNISGQTEVMALNTGSSWEIQGLAATSQAWQVQRGGTLFLGGKQIGDQLRPVYWNGSSAVDFYAAFGNQQGNICSMLGSRVAGICVDSIETSEFYPKYTADIAGGTFANALPMGGTFTVTDYGPALDVHVRQIDGTWLVDSGIVYSFKVADSPRQFVSVFQPTALIGSATGLITIPPLPGHDSLQVVDAAADGRVLMRSWAMSAGEASAATALWTQAGGTVSIDATTRGLVIIGNLAYATAIADDGAILAGGRLVVPLPTVSLTGVDTVATNAGDAMTLTATRSGGSTLLPLDVQVDSGVALQGPALIHIPGGASSGSQTFLLAAGNPGSFEVSPAASGPGAPATAAWLNGGSPVTITSAAGGGSLSLSGIGHIDEGGIGATFTVSRSGDTSQAVAFSVVLSGGSAGWADVSASPAVVNERIQLAIPADQVSVTFTLTAVDDTADEGYENLNLALSDLPPGWTAANQTTLDINDNDQTQAWINIIRRRYSSGAVEPLGRVDFGVRPPNGLAVTGARLKWPGQGGRVEELECWQDGSGWGSGDWRMFGSDLVPLTQALQLFPSGTYTFEIDVAGQPQPITVTKTHDSLISFPPFPAITAPADLSTGVGLTPTISWTGPDPGWCEVLDLGRLDEVRHITHIEQLDNGVDGGSTVVDAYVLSYKRSYAFGPVAHGGGSNSFLRSQTLVRVVTMSGDPLNHYQPPANIHRPAQVATDPANGERYLVGDVRSQDRDLDPTAGDDWRQGGLASIYVTKMNANGTRAWSQIIGGAGSQSNVLTGARAEACAVLRASGVIYVLGLAEGSGLGIGGSGAVDCGGTNRLIVAALDASTGNAIAGFGSNGLMALGIPGHAVMGGGLCFGLPGWIMVSGTVLSEHAGHHDTADAVVARINASTGALDTGFGSGNGWVRFGGTGRDYAGAQLAYGMNSTFLPVTLFSDDAGFGGSGSIGHGAAVVAIKDTGLPEPLWSGDGVLPITATEGVHVDGVAIAPNGLAIAGAFGGSLAIDGTPSGSSGGASDAFCVVRALSGDASSFGAPHILGTPRNDNPEGAARVQAIAGKLYVSTTRHNGDVAESAVDGAVYALNPGDGSLLPTFGSNGVVVAAGTEYTEGVHVAELPGSRLLLVGTTQSPQLLVSDVGIASTGITEFGASESYLVEVDQLTGLNGADAAAVIIASPYDAYLDEGQSLRLSVLASGHPRPTYQWFRDGSPIPGATGAAYAVASVTAVHAGTYRCEAFNGIGAPAMSGPAMVQVNAGSAPAIIDQPDSISRSVGQSASFTVAASGSPELAYTWRKDGQLLPPGPGIGPTLLIEPVDLDDAGSYTCTVSNGFGQAISSAAVLTVTPAVPPIAIAWPVPDTEIPATGLRTIIVKTGAAVADVEVNIDGVRVPFSGWSSGNGTVWHFKIGRDMPALSLGAHELVATSHGTTGDLIATSAPVSVTAVEATGHYVVETIAAPGGFTRAKPTGVSASGLVVGQYENHLNEAVIDARAFWYDGATGQLTAADHAAMRTALGLGEDVVASQIDGIAADGTAVGLAWTGSATAAPSTLSAILWTRTAAGQFTNVGVVIPPGTWPGDDLDRRPYAVISATGDIAGFTVAAGSSGVTDEPNFRSAAWRLVAGSYQAMPDIHGALAGLVAGRPYIDVCSGATAQHLYGTIVIQPEVGGPQYRAYHLPLPSGSAVLLPWDPANGPSFAGAPRSDGVGIFNAETAEAGDGLTYLWDPTVPGDITQLRGLGASGILSFEVGFTVRDLLVGSSHPANGSEQIGTLVRSGYPAEALEHRVHPSQVFQSYPQPLLSNLMEVRAAYMSESASMPQWLVANGRLFVDSAAELALVLRPSAYPTCSLAAPSSVELGQSLALTATASDDADARCLAYGIAKVEFWQDGSKLSEDASAPYTWLVTPVAAGSTSFTAKAFDITGLMIASNDVAVTVTVPSNPPPEIANGPSGSVSVGEDATVPGSLVLNGTDNHGPVALQWAIIGTQTLGSASLSATNGASTTFNYVPNADAFGSEDVTVRLTDDQGASDTIQITVTIIPEADAPVLAAIGARSTAEDTALIIALSATDVDGQSLTYSAGGVTGGTAAVVGSTLTFTPTPNYAGPASLTVTVSDGVLNDSETVAITVTPVNDPPTVAVDSLLPLVGSVEEDHGPVSIPGVLAKGPGGGADEAGETVSVLSVNAANPTLFSVAPAFSADGTLTYTLAPDASGSTQITVMVRDTLSSASATWTLTIGAVNDAPVNTALPQISGAQSVGQVQTATTGTWNDLKDQASPAISYAYQWQRASDAGGTGAADIAGATAPTYVLQAGDAWVRVVVTATDDGVGTPARQSAGAASAWRRGGNAVPTIAPVATVTAAEDGGAVTINLVGNDTDTVAAGWIWTIDAAGAKGACSDPADGVAATSFTYTPDSDAFGSDSVTVRLADGDGASATQVIAISITPVDDAPSFAKGADRTVVEDAGAQTVAGWATAISAGPGESGTLAFAIASNSNAGLFAAGPAVAADGTLTFTPAADANGTATVGVRLSDGAVASAIQTFSITVTAVNDPPVISLDPAASSLPTVNLEDAAPVSVAGYILGLAPGGGADEAAQTVSSGIVASDPSLFSVQPAYAAGLFTYTLAANAHGSSQITLTATDSLGASATASWTLNVLAVNDAPAFIKGSDRIVAHDAGAQTVAGWATGIGSGPNDGVQALSFAATATTPALFSVQPAIAADGTLSFTPAIGAFGSTTVSVTLHDDGGTAGGGVDTSAAQVFTITVNRAPVFSVPAAAITVTGTHGSPISLSASAGGLPAPTLQWRRNGAALAGATGGSLNLTGDVADDGAVYTCVATNSGGSTVSPAITLRISGVLPAFTTSPVAHSAAFNATTTFTAAASGQPAPTLQWLRNGVPIAGATGGTLTFTVQAADAGALYACQASNAAGSVTSVAAALTVTGLAAPTVGTPMQNPSPAAIGASATFSVVLGGTPAPTCQWQRSDGGGAFADIAGATGPALVLQDVQASPAVQVRCVATNVAGSTASAAATLAVSAGPTITTQPADQTVAAGAVAAFSVASDGDAWQWQELAGGTWSDVADTDATLSFTASLSDNGKRYRCLVGKSGVVQPTRAALLTISGVPVTITGQPANRSAELDEVVTFSVTAAGSAPFTYQWQRAEAAGSFAAIPGATGHSLTLRAQVGDNGDRFRCVVDNAVTADPGLASNEAVLTVNVTAPVITDPVAAATIELGLSANLVVTATGTPAPTFAWQSSPDGSSDWTTVVNAAAPTLTVTPSALGASYFRCIATNAVGSDVSAVAQVTATSQAPQILDQPAAVLAVAGSPVVLRVRASGLPAPTYQWERAENGGAFSTMGGENAATLAFTATAGDDADRFRCVVANAGGSVTSAEAVVTVQPAAIAPVITAQPTIAGAVDIGDAVVLTLTATGTPTPSYQWKRNMVDLAGETFPVLRLTAAYADDGASYTCLVANSAGSVTSAAVVLEVNPDAPVITSEPTGLATVAGKPFTLAVTATGTPVPTYQWRKDGSDIAGATAATLTILRPSLADAGSYTCVASNAGGSATSTVAVVSVELNAFPLLGQLVDTATELTVPATPWHWQLAAGGLLRWDGSGYQPVGADEALAAGEAYFLSGTTDPVLRDGFAIVPFSEPPPVQLEDDAWTPVTVIGGQINIDGTPQDPIDVVNDPATEVVIWYVDPGTGQQVMVGDPEEIFGASDGAVPAGATLWIITNDAPALAPSAGG